MNIANPAPSRPAVLAFAITATAALVSLPLSAGHLSGYAAPYGLSAQVHDAANDGNNDDVALRWPRYVGFPTGCDRATQIRIFRSDDSGPFQQIFAADGTATSYDDTDLGEATYDYVIQARCNVPAVPGGGGADTNNLSLVSAPVTAVISHAPPCAGPALVSATATPTVLWPPNGKFVTVNVTGNVTPQQNCAMPDGIVYTVIDEYNELSTAPVAVALASGAFSFQFQVEASRKGTDLDGRLYAIDIETADGGNHGFDVVVPHDQRKK
ncbi:MAG: hypothetical protein M3Q42_15125 [Pseudomonadota bacterium]|nr:hypothetical protein [Pseudomonadota bacterium]